MRASAHAFCSVDKVIADDLAPRRAAAIASAAPAAADLEQAVAGLEVEAVEQGVDLVLLAFSSVVRRRGEQRRAVGHAGSSHAA